MAKPDEFSDEVMAAGYLQQALALMPHRFSNRCVVCGVTRPDIQDEVCTRPSCVRAAVKLTRLELQRQLGLTQTLAKQRIKDLARGSLDIRAAFEEGFGLSKLNGPIVDAWDRSEARQAAAL